MYCYQRSQYIRLHSKKNSFRGNYMRKYGMYFLISCLKQSSGLCKRYTFGPRGSIQFPSTWSWRAMIKKYIFIYLYLLTTLKTNKCQWVRVGIRYSAFDYAFFHKCVSCDVIGLLSLHKSLLKKRYYLVVTSWFLYINIKYLD